MLALFRLCWTLVSLQVVRGFGRMKPTKFDLSLLRGKIGKGFTEVVAVTIASLILAPSPAAPAMIAPLADVGIGTYLVKDGRQLLRLSLPVGPDMLLGAKARQTGNVYDITLWCLRYNSMCVYDITLWCLRYNSMMSMI
jgi:hypothetical protein